jgi:PEP-CTERM motif
LDIYGLLFDIGGGRVVNFWSNGDLGSGVDYGVAVATSAMSLDYVSGGVVVPEPGSLALLGAGIALFGAVRRRAAPAAGEFVERSALRSASGGLCLLRGNVSAGGRPIYCPGAFARLCPGRYACG